MATVFDYLKWRGDLSFSRSPFNIVDAAILSKCSYLHFLEAAGPVPEDSAVPLPRIRDILFSDGSDHTLGLVIPPQIFDLFDLAASTKRFSAVRIFDMEDILDREKEIQFSAMTFELSSSLCVVTFRGTDDSIVGWKEDFNMAFEKSIPSQKLAAAYLHRILCTHPGNVILTGHSKGGNLAIFAAASCNAEERERIQTVYNFDGPGFKPDFLESEGYLSIVSRIRTAVPESSIIGCLFEQLGEKIYVVSSVKGGLRQHNLLTWQVIGPEFETVPTRSRDSIQMEKAIKAWTADMSEQETEDFVNTVFSLPAAASVTNLKDLSRIPNAGFKMIQAPTPEQRKILLDGFRKLIAELYTAHFQKQPKPDPPAKRPARRKNGG